jgi:hypothetical protein
MLKKNSQYLLSYSILKQTIELVSIKSESTKNYRVYTSVALAVMFFYMTATLNLLNIKQKYVSHLS